MSSVRTDFVTQGTYNVYRATDSGLSFTAGTEYASSRLSNQVAASGKDEMYSWIRGMFRIIHSDASVCSGEWFVLKQKTTDALPDMDTSAEVEVLQKEKRIFAHGMFSNGSATYYPPKWIKFQLYNVKLNDGEELRFVFKPFTTTVGHGQIMSIMEWRAVGQ